jgi:aryl-alcohol dehydrogenase-like predicted oxidoreductase
MKYNQLGNTGMFVSEICLGTMTFTGDKKPSGMWAGIGDVDQKLATQIVSRSLEAGVNFLDTADVYSAGQSERLTGQAIKDVGIKRSSVVIATKCYGRMGPGPNDLGASRGHIMDAVARSLERLGTDHIDLYQIHATDVVTPVEETMRALDDLTRQGMVRYVGCSNWQAWKIMKALGISDKHGYARFETLQAYYSIAGRDLERELVPMMQDQKVGLMVWSPLAGGLLSGKYGPGSNGPEGARRTAFDFPPVDKDRAWKCVDAMRAIADKKGVSVAQIALAYILHKPFVTTVIIGAKTTDQLDDNLAAVKVHLSADEMKSLDDSSALPMEYPGWMLARQSAERIPQAK